MADVFGTGDPADDVFAVQQAVDAGGEVVLHGAFSFENQSFPGPSNHRRVILVTRSVKVRGDDATIRAGGTAADGGFQAAFLIDSTTADVEFETIRFENPLNAAIRALKSGDLRIAECEIDGIVPTAFGVLNGGLGIDLRGGAFGDVGIADNRLRIGGTGDDTTGGIAIAGSATGVTIAGNRVSDTTAHGMNLQNIGGPVRVERNVVTTGRVGRGGGPGEFVDALRVLGTGQFRVARNELDCGFENGAVVRVAATTNAEVRQNEITSSVAPNETPGAESAGLQVRGSATGNEILQNRIRGRGRVAVSVVHSDFSPDKPGNSDGNPKETTFTGNNVQQFDATVATVEVGEGALNTTITGGSGTIIDNGTGTVVQGGLQPVP